MATQSDVLILAQAHIDRMNNEAPVHPHYQYGLNSPIEYAHCWYFDYRILPRLDSPPSRKQMFAGAPGFVISKQNTELNIISWHEMQQLAEQSTIWQQCDLTTAMLLKTPLNLAVLRAHLPLKMPALVTFKKRLEMLGSDGLAKEQLLKTTLLQVAGFVDIKHSDHSL
jgi:hypothetical protein